MTIPQAGDIWKFQSSDDLYPHETWFIIEQVEHSLGTHATLFFGMCIETGAFDNFFYSKYTAEYWTRLA